MPGGGDDPKIRKIDPVDETYEFHGNGVNGQRYTLYDDGADSIVTRFFKVPTDPPGHERAFIGGLDVNVNGVYVGVAIEGTPPKAMLHVIHGDWHLATEIKVCTLDAPGHKGKLFDDFHPLMGVEHMNVDIKRWPEREGRKGLVVDGDTQPPETYEVEG